MTRRKTIGRTDLDKLYPRQDLSGFEPTHHVEVLVEGRVAREDFVRLEEGEPASYAYTPGSAQPAYARLTTGLWQCLDRHGRVRGREVTYKPAYRAPTEAPGFVYFVQAGEGGPIKIGWSEDVERRLRELQVGNPAKVRLLGAVPGTMRDEQVMHERFAHCRGLGEWFRPEPEILEFLAIASR